MRHNNFIHNIHKAAADLITVSVSLLSFFYNESDLPKIVWYIAFSLVIMSLMWFIYDFCIKMKEGEEHKLNEMEIRFSKLMLKFDHNINKNKRLEMLEITYEKKSTCYPVDFSKNYLVYGVHKQIRTILNELGNAIMEFAGQTDPDTIKVDLIYCYPEECKLAEGNIVESSDWKVIKAVTDAPTDTTHRKLLSDQNSFYRQFDSRTFIFQNNKGSDGIGYVMLEKDKEYKNVGSIVGTKFEIVNDIPESEQVRAILTITTFGWCLWDKSFGVSEEKFINLFKQYVINGCKSALGNELTQKYIRHRLQHKTMCPYSGMPKPKPEDDRRLFDCPYCAKGDNDSISCHKVNGKCMFFE